MYYCHRGLQLIFALFYMTKGYRAKQESGRRDKSIVLVIGSSQIYFKVFILRNIHEDGAVIVPQIEESTSPQNVCTFS